MFDYVTCCCIRKQTVKKFKVYNALLANYFITHKPYT